MTAANPQNLSMSEEKLPDIRITNFRQVTDWLYRGGQPTAQQLRQLDEAGIRTVISFRWNSDILQWEREAISQTNMNLVPIPLSYWTLPSHKDIERFFNTLDDESMRPIFIHCKHGADRTGIFTAMYRMTRQGWDFDRAYKEMRDSGFHKVRMHHLKWVLFGYWRRLQRSRHRAGIKTNSALDKNL